MHVPYNMTITVTPGGADRFEAIIGPGQSSVLAIGREHDAVVARGGVAVVATGVHLTLSVDHRLIDGLVGATFLGELADALKKAEARQHQIMPQAQRAADDAGEHGRGNIASVVLARTGLVDDHH